MTTHVNASRFCRFVPLFAVVCLTLTPPPAGAACDDPLSTPQLVETLPDEVVGIANSGDQRLFILRKRGIIEVIDGQLQPQPFLDIDALVFNPTSDADERGLLGLAFHPDYAANGYFYVNYIDNNSNSVVARFSRSAGDPNLADPLSEQIVLTLVQPYSNHNGGSLAFGPDGTLYLGFGDGGSSGDPSCNAQNTDRWLGKILRIDVDGDDFPGDATRNYAVPPDNPFVGAGNPLDEIWALGVRNPWRINFDRETGDLWIGDVGQNLWEEVSFQPSASPGGENYGWKVMEAQTCYDPDPIDTDCPPSTPSCFDPSYTDPVYSYSHNSGRCSIVGGTVYRGGLSGLRGCYVFADYCSGEVFAFDPSAPPAVDTAPVISNALGFGVTTIGEDSAGALYIAVGSQVYSLTPPWALFIDGFESGGLGSWSSSTAQ